MLNYFMLDRYIPTELICDTNGGFDLRYFTIALRTRFGENGTFLGVPLTIDS